MLICQISDCEFTNSHLSWKHNPWRFLRGLVFPNLLDRLSLLLSPPPVRFFYQDGLLWHLYFFFFGGGGEGEKRPEKKLSCSAVKGVWDLNLQKEGLFLVGQSQETTYWHEKISVVIHHLVLLLSRSRSKVVCKALNFIYCAATVSALIFFLLRRLSQ